MGPVTIAVDSYGPVTDNAQSVYELSQIEDDPRHPRRTQEELRLRRRFRKGQASPGRKRRRGQHLQGHRQAGADRNRRGRRHHHDLLDHLPAHQSPQGQSGQSVDSVSALLPGPGHRRRDDLLVHRRIHPGRDHRRLSRGGVHQGQHQAGRRDQGQRRRIRRRWSRSARSTPRKA